MAESGAEPTEVILARAVLERHYRDSVFTVKEFCAILNEWVTAIDVAWKSGRALVGSTPGQHWHDQGPSIMLAAAKSSFLGRRFYGKEALRTERCPEHDGHWSGLPLNQDCVHGCQFTGWLKTP